MSIKSLYRDYFQKSRVFLYPALDIRRAVTTTPIETYASWKGHYKLEDRKLICLYYLRQDEDFRVFEKNKLLGNKYFHDFKQVEDGKGVYIFDFDELKHEWDCFLKGRYSQMSLEHKKKIKAFYGPNNANFAYIESYLHPEKYYHMYSELLGVSVELLKQAGELCEIYDLKQESLKIQVKNLDIKGKLT